MKARSEWANWLGALLFVVALVYSVPVLLVMLTVIFNLLGIGKTP